jgi:hypothetical protein
MPHCPNVEGLTCAFSPKQVILLRVLSINYWLLMLMSLQSV